MEWFESFKRAYDNYPSQDNEGFIPERGAFKLGFHDAWNLRQVEIVSLKARIEKLRDALYNITKTQCPHFATMKQTCTCVYDDAYIALIEDDEAKE